MGGRQARRQREEWDKQIDSKEDTHPICCLSPLIPSYMCCVLEIHHLGPKEDWGRGGGSRQLSKPLGQFFPNTDSVQTGLGGGRTDSCTGRLKCGPSRGGRERRGDGKIQTGWKQSDKKVRRRTWGQTEEIRWAGPGRILQRDQLRLTDMGQRAFHLLRSCMKDISALCACIGASVSIDVLNLVWLCTPLRSCSGVCLSACECLTMSLWVVAACAHLCVHAGVCIGLSVQREASMCAPDAKHAMC